MYIDLYGNYSLRTFFEFTLLTNHCLQIRKADMIMPRQCDYELFGEIQNISQIIPIFHDVTKNRCMGVTLWQLRYFESPEKENELFFNKEKLWCNSLLIRYYHNGIFLLNSGEIKEFIDPNKNNTKFSCSRAFQSLVKFSFKY